VSRHDCAVRALEDLSDRTIAHAAMRQMGHSCGSKAMLHLTARMAAVLVVLATGSIAPMAQPESQPTDKPLSPELERIIRAMPPDARPAVRRILESQPGKRRALELGEKHMAEKRPHWTRETVQRKIRVVFPGSDPAQVLAMLASAGGSARVQLAIVKLCNEGKGLSDLAHYVDEAKGDYRDVLSWAEYPNEGKLPLSASDSDRDAAQKRDQEQYLRWIERDRK
jgi:hypothetical protein